MNLEHGVRLPIATISGPKVRYISAPSDDALVQHAGSAIRELRAKYPDSEALAVVHLQYWAPHFHRKDKSDPVAERLLNDEVIKEHYQFGFWTKGKEYIAGVVVCPANFMSRDLGGGNLMRLNTMFGTVQAEP